MRLTRLLIPGLLLLPLLVATPAPASHGCWRYVGAGCLCPEPAAVTSFNADPLGLGVPTTTLHADGQGRLLVVVSGAETYYLVTDETRSLNNGGSLWIYQETNGVENLQRHDEYCYTKDFDSDELADTLLF